VAKIIYLKKVNSDSEIKDIERQIDKMVYELYDLTEEELNLISWNEKDPKYDLRDWSPEHEKMGKGITLNIEELKKLKELLDGVVIAVEVDSYPENCATASGKCLRRVIAAFVYEQDKAGMPLTLDELLTLNHVYFERRIDSEIAGKLIQKGSSAGHALLERLVERNLIEAKGEKRGSA
jgi:hypothetical protein